ncbi:hypothetical protein [Plantibacter sp. VKM Ac-2876]|jgi:hypothetical protein|uniref:hypothetical protein n=1 Tax=Plantibacter sp. VKM Ac-2876 TaxID=2783826 RepID=UPI00188CA4B6|nr:hypothetical protein [Plantibacter sp. VKM Ac-2876]MBF4563617.1 hypothetical protein [Plantibacter sp. VKM Ac-2876]
MTVTTRHPGVVRVGGRLMVVDPFAERGELTEGQQRGHQLRRRITLLLGAFLLLTGFVVGATVGVVVEWSLVHDGRSSVSLPGFDPEWAPGLDVVGALLGAILVAVLLLVSAERRNRRRRLDGGHQPSRWIDPLNDHLIGLSDDLPWTSLWTLTRMYATAERLQRELVERSAALGEVGSDAQCDLVEARFAADDARDALEKTATLMGVIVPEGPLPDAQAILADSARLRARRKTS